MRHMMKVQFSLIEDSGGFMDDNEPVATLTEVALDVEELKKAGFAYNNESAIIRTHPEIGKAFEVAIEHIRAFAPEVTNDDQTNG